VPCTKALAPGGTAEEAVRTHHLTAIVSGTWNLHCSFSSILNLVSEGGQQCTPNHRSFNLSLTTEVKSRENRVLFFRLGSSTPAGGHHGELHPSRFALTHPLSSFRYNRRRAVSICSAGLPLVGQWQLQNNSEKNARERSTDCVCVCVCERAPFPR
jgi:hypothetical protein